jgi:hypothetical protein
MKTTKIWKNMTWNKGSNLRGWECMTVGSHTILWSVVFMIFATLSCIIFTYVKTLLKHLSKIYFVN